MIFYCPVCKKLDLDFTPDKDTPRVVNIRDGYGHPLYHMKCACGNCLATGIHFEKAEVEKDFGLLDYIKEVITGYNKDGCFYSDGYYEYVEDSLNTIRIRRGKALEVRKRLESMSPDEKKEYFDRQYKEMVQKLEGYK